MESPSPAQIRIRFCRLRNRKSSGLRKSSDLSICRSGAAFSSARVSAIPRLIPTMPEKRENNNEPVEKLHVEAAQTRRDYAALNE